MLAKDKQSSFFSRGIFEKLKGFILTLGVNIIKLFSLSLELRAKDRIFHPTLTFAGKARSLP